MTKIIAPNKQYTGLSASVLFTNGIGETEIPELIEWFLKHGYKVEDNKPKEVLEEVSEKLPEETEEENTGDYIPDAEEQLENIELIPLDDMSVEELKTYAEEKGIDLGKSTSKDGILKKIKDADK